MKTEALAVWLRRLLVALAIGLAAWLGALLAVALVGCGGAWRDAGCEWREPTRSWQCRCSVRRIVLDPHPSLPRPAARVSHLCDGRALPLTEDVERWEAPP